MPNRFARTFGATAILLAIVVAGLIQFAAADTPAVEISEGSGTSLRSSSSISASVASTEAADPFVYTIGILQGPSTENFWAYNAITGSVWDVYLMAPTKASLFRLDGRSLQLLPELAGALTSPVWDSDGWRVDIELREDMSWSDGNPMTADDFVFTFDTVRRLNLGGNWASSFPDAVVSVEALTTHRLRIRFSERPGLETWPFAVGTAPVMAQHFWGEMLQDVESASALYEIEGREDVAGGPLDVVEVEKHRVVSRANPGYPLRHARSVEYLIYGNEAELAEALQTGAVHTVLTPKGLSDENAAMLAGIEGVTTVPTKAYGVRYLGFNLERSPMDRAEFRAAIAYLLDREAMAEEFAPTAGIASTLMPPNNTLWYDAAAAEEISAGWSGSPDERLSAALDGLRSIGYTWAVEPAVANGEIIAGEGLQIDGAAPAPLTILTPGDIYDPARPRYADAIADRIELLGFSVIPVATDFATVVDMAFTPDEDGARHYDMVLLGWSLGNPAYPSFYRELFGSAGSANNTGYASAEMDRLLDDFDSATTIEEARTLMWEIESLLARDVPYLPLYSAQIIEAYRSDVINLDIEGMIGGIHGSLGGFDLVSPRE